MHNVDAQQEFMQGRSAVSVANCGYQDTPFGLKNLELISLMKIKAM